MPASTSARTRSGESVDGPRVQTIFARRATTSTLRCGGGRRRGRGRCRVRSACRGGHGRRRRGHLPGLEGATGRRLGGLREDIRRRPIAVRRGGAEPRLAGRRGGSGAGGAGRGVRGTRAALARVGRALGSGGGTART